MERHVKFSPGKYYHIYNRGVNKNKIFLADGDWKQFQRLLYLRNSVDGHIKLDRCKDIPLTEIDTGVPLVDIQAYALMPNHFHLLLSEREEGGISTFMRKLLTSYSMYINKKYERSGPLMCRPFRAQHVDNDEYMRWVISYIHLNPVELVQSNWEQQGIADMAAAHKALLAYSYSSYRDYYGEERDETVLLHKQSLPFFISDLEEPSNMLARYRSPLSQEPPRTA